MARRRRNSRGFRYDENGRKLGRLRPQWGAFSWLRVARYERRWSRQRLAEVSGVSPGAIIRAETYPDGKPHARTKERLAAALGYRVDDLWPENGITKDPTLLLIEKELRREGRLPARGAAA